VMSSSFDCPEKIPVDVCSNASCFKSFNSGSSSHKVSELCLTLRLVYVIALDIASTCALSRVFKLPCNNFVQKVIPKLKKFSDTAFKDLYVSRVPKNLIDIQTNSSQCPGHVFLQGFEVYSFTL
jgi:hypothetical protein